MSKEIEISNKELIKQMLESNPDFSGLTDKEADELRLRIECLLMGINAECKRRGLD